jgi:spore germination cell wall hydrolase CwlJ-like protein
MPHTGGRLLAVGWRLGLTLLGAALAFYGAQLIYSGVVDASTATALSTDDFRLRAGSVDEPMGAPLLTAFDRMWAADGLHKVDAQIAPPVVFFAYADAPTDANPAYAKLATDAAILRVGFSKDDGEGTWQPNALPLQATADSEIKCLATAIYFEARGEGVRGEEAVAQVILNRVKNPAYPKTICGVVYQNAKSYHHCQFSFACDGVSDTVAEKAAWREALRIAHRILTGGDDDIVAEIGDSTSYHNTDVAPQWANRMQRVDRIGHHVFYESYRSGSS